MFGSNKYKQQCFTLEQENQQLRDKVAELEKNVYEAEHGRDDLVREAKGGAENLKQLINTFFYGEQMIQNIREALASAAHQLLSEKGNLMEADNLFVNTGNLLDALRTRVSGISDVATDSADSVQNLEKVASQITQFVGVIRDISEQTNLLALNAAIEAARAGETGRGFAVVADEVRNLAQKAGEASDEISTLVDTVVQGTQVSTAQIQKMVEATTAVNQETEDIGNTVNEVLNMSRQMQGIIEESANTSFIQTVKLDHVAWKVTIYRHLIHQLPVQEGAIVNHENCRLGEWYYHGDGKNYQNLMAYRHLEEPHKLVHTSGIQAIEAQLAGNHEEVLKHLETMESASVKVVDCLSDLESAISSSDSNHGFHH
nr:methyl-accepting chemotaxis protein [Spartinivicinus sp. A2-2]